MICEIIDAFRQIGDRHIPLKTKVTLILCVFSGSDVFSLIRFIKERYSFTILTENSRAPGGEPSPELKSGEHFRGDWQQTQISDAVYSSSWSRRGSFITGTAPSFSIKQCANPVSKCTFL